MSVSSFSTSAQPPATPTLRRRQWMGGAIALGATALLGACGRNKTKAQPVPAGATVLALGDSLTSGVGATAETAYPAVWPG